MNESSDIFQTITDFYTQRFIEANLKISRKGNASRKTIYAHDDCQPTTKVEELAQSCCDLDDFPEGKEIILYMESKKYKQKVLKALSRALEAACPTPKDVSLKTSIVSKTEADENLAYVRSLIPHRDLINTPDEPFYFIDGSGKYVPGVDPESYCSAVLKTFEELKADTSIPICPRVYNPVTHERKFFDEILNLNCINTYNPPAWASLGEVWGQVHPNIEKLFVHLFPHEPDREFVYDWLYFALTRISGSVLCLVGARGTGKNFLVDNILRPLFGSENVAIASNSVLTDKFNDIFENKRIVYFDDCDLSEEESIKRFRQWTNTEIATEGKGTKVRNIQNYASFVISSNLVGNFRLNPQERRFSTPKLTDVPLLKAFTAREVADLHSFFTESEEGQMAIAEFYYYILERKPEQRGSESTLPRRTRDEPLKNDWFFEICSNNLTRWEQNAIRAIIQSAQEGEEVITQKDFEKAVAGKSKDKVVPKRAKLAQFVSDHRYKDMFALGEIIEVEGGEWVVQISEACMNHFRDESKVADKKAEKQAEEELGF